MFLPSNINWLIKKLKNVHHSEKCPNDNGILEINFKVKLYIKYIC